MPIFDESLAESYWRQDLAIMEGTIRFLRDAPPPGIHPELLALDIATCVSRRDELRRKLGLSPAEADRKPKVKRKG